MPRYDQIYDRLARRAVEQGGLDLRTFIEQMEAAGTSLDRIEEMLLDDLARDGPIFGRFMRNLSGAAASSTVAAGRQGEVAGKFASDAELREAMRILESDFEDIDDAVYNEADPETLEEIEAGLADRVPYAWVCTFVNTCHLCLPLHQVTMPLSSWNERGLHPDSIHANEGWSSPCYCKLIPDDEADPDDLKEPLVRIKEAKPKTTTGLKVRKRTMRSVLQKDIDKAIAARDKAIQSLEGRRTLRVAGKLQEE